MKAAERHVVVISREWHNPEIKIDVIDTDETSFNGIAISMTLPDFLKALGAEFQGGVGAAVRLELEEAAERVISSMKRESVRVM